MKYLRSEEGLAPDRISMATLTFFRWIEQRFLKPLLFIPPLLYTETA
jgi:hypothetical protein